jgi:hypothetical protein
MRFVKKRNTFINYLSLSFSPLAFHGSYLNVAF